MTDLNELLKKRAEKKLDADIAQFLKAINSSVFMRALEKITVNVPGEAKPPSLGAFLWWSDYKKGSAGELIEAAFKEEYITREALQFIEQVDSFKTQLDELKDGQ